MELTTGVRTDGTIVARQGHLIIDNGAYSMDEPFLGQMAAMFAVGPYRIPHVDVAADVVYTNTQPSGSVRAPTGPTTCWALEQHHDVVAERLGLDPVEFRRRNLVHEGDEGPTGQVFERIGVIETLEHAAAAIDWDRPLEDGEAVGIATGWWPSFPGPSGAHLTINADGSGTIVTGAQECGTGSVMALPILAAEVLGMRPDEFRILYQDTDAGPYDGGASGSQTTFNNGRAVIAAANEIREQLLDLAADFLEANRADLELVDGMVRVKGSQTSSVTIADLASEAAGAGLLLGRGSGQPPPTPAVNAASCVGRLGGESFAAPTFFTHAARVKVDRDTGVVRVLEIAASHESGHGHQPDRGRGPDPRRRGDGDRPGPQRGRPPHRGRPAAQPVSPRLQAPDRGRRAADDRRLRRRAVADRRSQGPQGHRRATVRPDARGHRERHRPGHRHAGPGAADDAGAGLRRDRVGESRGLTWTCGSRLRRRSRTR